MAINLRPHSETGALTIESSEYEGLAQRKERGWSHCADEKEWLAKLHYLRQGFKSGKLQRNAFEERETRLVEAWLRQSL